MTYPTKKLAQALCRLALIAPIAAFSFSISGQSMAAQGVAEYKSSGELIRPVGYREWVYIGTPLTPNDMNNGKAAFPEFHNVYIDPDSWAYWKTNGEFRDGTVIVKELVSVGSKSATSGNGYFMGEYLGLEATIKDKSRFPASDNYWGYFRFSTEDHGSLLRTSKIMPSQSCATCHSGSAQQDMVFTQYYPVLRAAKAKGEMGPGGK